MKPRPIIQYALFAIGAFALSIAACSGSKTTVEQDESAAFADFRDEVSAVVAPERQQGALDSLDEMRNAYFEVNQKMEDRMSQFRQLNANYDTTEAELRQATAATEKQMKSNFDEFVTSFRQFRAQMTEEEWDAISKTGSKAMEAAVAALMDR